MIGAGNWPGVGGIWLSVGPGKALRCEKDFGSKLSSAYGGHQPPVSQRGGRAGPSLFHWHKVT